MRQIGRAQKPVIIDLDHLNSRKKHLCNVVDDKGGLLLMDLAVYFRDTDGVIFQEEFKSKNKGIKEM